MRTRPTTRWTASGLAVLFALLAAPPAARAAGTDPSPDLASQPKPDAGPPPEWAGKELPVRIIPNIPQSAEAYYAPDNLHVIAQTKDPKAVQPEKG